MSNSNQTKITEFLLLGFMFPQTVNTILFILLLVLYISTLCANITIITLVSTSQTLHSPMYFFLSQLSLSDILLSTNVVPEMLCATIADGILISVNECDRQLFFLGISITAQCFLLTVMAYDRYLAITNPLHYITIMGIKLCRILVTWSWVLGFISSSITTTPISLLEFCGCNIIDHIYCDLVPLFEASCSDTFIIEVLTIVLTIPVILFPFLIIILTYARIFFTIIKITPTSGRLKTFSTCSSHLTVVSMYYGILITKYTIPSRSHSQNLTKVISALFTVVTPLLNPIIYSLRNQEIRAALKKWISIKLVVRKF